MSTRFYYGQKDYIEQLNNMDDVATASATSAAASAAAAEASADDAAASAAAASGAVGTGLANVGLGITSTAPFLANVDDVTAGAGFYYVNGTTTGTFPVTASPGMVMHKVYGGAGFQMYQPYGASSLYYRRRSSSTWQTWIELAPLNNPTFTGTVSGITKAMVGLGNVDNTSDANKPVSAATQTALNAKEPTITAGTTAQYWRGDKSWQTLDKSAVGLGNVDNTSDANKPVSTAQAAANAATLASANTYADGLVVSMWDDRGNYDASSNTFPTTGGSGSAGAVKKNDIWTISVAGTLGGTPVAVRQFIRALIDTPGQTSTNWAIGLANTDIDDSITDGVTGRAPSQNAVFDALALKAPLASPPLTGTPTAPTAAAGTSTTQLATCAFVQGEKASPTFTGTTTVDNLTISGVGRRIVADFTNATQTSRTLFQTSAANSVSAVGVIPSGSGAGANLNVFNNSDPTNAGVMQLGINSTFASVNSFITGTGTYLPLSFMTGGAERFKLAATTNRLQADFSNATVASRLLFQSSTLNGLTSVSAIPNGTATNASFIALNGSDPDNAGLFGISLNSTGATLISNKTGTGAVVPMSLNVGGNEVLRLDTLGNFLFGTTNSGDPIGVRVNGIKMDASTKAIYSRCTAGWEIGIAATSGTNVNFYTDNGSSNVAAGTITSNGSTTAYNTSSDYRLKTSLKPMTGALESLKQIKFKTWIWETDGREGEGAVAHELADIEHPIPDAVQGEKDAVKIGKSGDEVPDYQGVDYSKLVPRIGCAVQEMDAKFEAAMKRIEELEALVAAMK